MFKAVIFDFDGVIADSEPLHCQAIIEVLRSNGIDVTQQQYYSDYLGYSDLECFQAVYRDRQIVLSGDTAQKLIKDKSVIFERIAESRNTIIEGVSEFVGLLRENKIPAAICSGALLNDIQLMLNGSGMKDAFEVIVTADDVRKGKPDPEGYLLTLERMKAKYEISPDQCIVIEDSIWGLNAARAAGMKAIGVTNTYDTEQLEHACDLVVESLANLTMDDLNRL